MPKIIEAEAPEIEEQHISNSENKEPQQPITKPDTDDFDSFLTQLNNDEKSEKEQHEKLMEDLYYEWSTTLQSVRNQFLAVSDVFKQIEDNSDKWEMDISEIYLLTRRILFKTDDYKFKINISKNDGGHGIWLEYAIHSDSDYMADGKERLKHAGNDFILGLPSGYALINNKLDQDDLVKQAIKVFYSVDPIEFREQRSIRRSLKLPDSKLEGQRILKSKGYDLSLFYQSEDNMKNLLDRAKNNLVVVEASTPNSEPYLSNMVGVNVTAFGACNIVDIVKKIFMDMNKGQLTPVKEYFSPTYVIELSKLK